MVTARQAKSDTKQRAVRIPFDGKSLDGDLHIPALANGVVLFAHGSGSSRFSPRNQFVAQVILSSNHATLLFDLLTEQEEEIDLETHELRFDIGLLAQRLIAATNWVNENDETKNLQVGYFGSSTGAAAALVAAAHFGEGIGAVVSRGGRPDLAGDALGKVTAPTLLIVGGDDDPVIELNKFALTRMICEKELRFIPGATHLFEEPGKLEEVAGEAADWFSRHL